MPLMPALPLEAPRRLPWMRHSPRDALLVALAVLHGVLLFWLPSAWLIALTLWWNANTVSHWFIHLPFFRAPELNRLFSIFLSLLLGFPQSVWRARHLAHHRGIPFRWGRLGPDWKGEGVAVLLLWLVLLGTNPGFFLAAYLPGWLAGLALCQLQGHFEHHRGTVSHYGKLYNLLFFNDGFHLEHHAWPAHHWTQLPRRRTIDPDASPSRWPPVLRWLELLSLDGLERLALSWAPLQRFVLRCHQRAVGSLLSSMPSPRSVTIIGGGLFPRTALVLRRLAPTAQLRIVEAREDHLKLAQPHLDATIQLVRGFFDSSSAARWSQDADLLVIPLAFAGDKESLYRQPPTRHVLVHDWLWRKRGKSVVVSAWLLKRLNLVAQ